MSSQWRACFNGVVADDRTRPFDSLRAELMRQRLHARMFGESSPPPRIARFRVLEPLGSGGMGTVYLAWDETLGRSIALKFLHRREGDELVAEAQALARLAHPNVITVFDVGVHEGRVWLAMEYVRGRTLRAWQRERPGRDELLATWLAAGRGLAAIHAAGLVHRDIKPDNVLLGEDGRVRVIDFGLVFASSSTTATSERSGSGDDSTARLGFAGTWDYAAPEQREGLPIDARADQFAFGVSVWEAFAGERPVRDDSGAMQGSDVPGVPRRVNAALRRALAVDPSERWPSMVALLEALEPRRRRLGWVAAVAAASGLGVVVGLLSGPEPEPTIDRCALAGADLDPGVASTLDEGPLRSAVDQWVLDWQAAAVRACEDHERAPLPALLGQRSACLDYQKHELLGLLDHLARVRTSEQTLDSRRLELGDPRACLRGGHRALALPIERADEVAELRRALADLEHRTSDRAITLLDVAERRLAEARAIAWPPVIAEAALVLARVHVHAGDPHRARALIGEALDLAQRHDQPELAARAWSSMVELTSELELDPDAAEWAWQRQRAVLERLGPTPLERGRLSSQQAWIAQLRGDPVTTERALRDAIDEFEQAGVSGRLKLPSMLDRLALLLGEAGRLDEMRALNDRRRALELELESGTRAGPVAGEAERAFEAAQLALADGDHAEAIVELERALVGFRHTSGSESPQVAQTHVALAQVHDAEGSLDQAELHAERADAICLVRLGPDHPLRTATLSALGTIALRRGDPEAAVRSFRRALQIEQRQPEGTGVDRALARSNLAEALIAAGDPSEARWQAELALTELSASIPADHPDLAYPHKALGWALLELDDRPGAREHLARALALSSGSAVEAGEIEALLARAN
jgi:tetratricopeptide (TPR) repeat protein/predicted Ser/Thr protein kinase